MCVDLALENVPLDQLHALVCPNLEAFSSTLLATTTTRTSTKQGQGFLSFLKNIGKEHNVVLCGESLKLLGAALSESPVALSKVERIVLSGACGVSHVARLLAACHNLSSLNLEEVETDDPLPGLMSVLAALLPVSLRYLWLPPLTFAKTDEATLLLLVEQFKNHLRYLEFKS